MDETNSNDSDLLAPMKSRFPEQKALVHIGAELTDAGPGFAEISLPWSGEVTQQNGYFHAGIITMIADTAGGFAAYTLAPPETNVLAAEFKVNFIGPAKGERIIARAEVVKSGKRLTVCRIDIFSVEDGAETLCALMQQTLIQVADDLNSAAPTHRA